MKIKPLYLVMLLAGMILCACDDEKPNSTGDAEASQFVGKYEITIVTDSIKIEDQWYSAEFAASIGKTYPDMHGTMTITATDTPNKVHVTTLVSETGTNPYEYYVTDGTVTADNTLILEPSTISLGEEYPTILNFTYENIEAGEELHFKAHALYNLWSTDYGYVLSNTAKKINE